MFHRFQDEVQLLKNLKKLLKRVKQLNAENVVVTADMFKQLQQEFNVPDHLLE
jgi:hypothetical protein